jgi:hypothetical protein
MGGVPYIGRGSSIPWADLTDLPDLVNTFNGRYGDVVPTSGDYSFADISGTATNSQLAGPLLTALSATNGLRVSNPAGVGAASYSLVLNGATLSLSSGGLALNLGNANTWTAAQTFDAGLTIGGEILGQSDLIIEGVQSGSSAAQSSTFYLQAWTGSAAISVGQHVDGSGVLHWISNGGGDVVTLDQNGNVVFSGAGNFSGAITLGGSLQWTENNSTAYFNADNDTTFVFRATSSTTVSDASFAFQAQNGASALVVGGSNIKFVGTANNTLDDGSGNLSVAGAVTAASFSGTGAVSAVESGSSSATITNSSGTTESSGVGATVTCGPSGRILAISRVSLLVSPSGNSANVYLYRSTAGIPAAGSAPAAGDVVVAADSVLTNGHSTLEWVDTGLTNGTVYYYYLATSTASNGVEAILNTNALTNNTVVVSLAL